MLRQINLKFDAQEWDGRKFAKLKPWIVKLLEENRLTQNSKYASGLIYLKVSDHLGERKIPVLPGQYLCKVLEEDKYFVLMEEQLPLTDSYTLIDRELEQISREASTNLEAEICNDERE